MSSTVTATFSGFDSADTPVLKGVALTKSISQLLTESNGDGQANVIYGQDIALGAGATVEVDLQTALDAYGVALALTDVAAIWIEAPDSNPDDVIVTQGASNGFSSWIEDGTSGGGFRVPSGEFVLASGFGLASLPSNGTNKTLAFTNADGGVAASIQVRLLGRRP